MSLFEFRLVVFLCNLITALKSVVITILGCDDVPDISHNVVLQGTFAFFEHMTEVAMR